MKLLFRTLPLFLVSLFIFSNSASAFYIQSGQDISLSKDKSFNETVIIAGNTLTIDSNINGDLICAGQNITINGSIKGNIICAGQNLTINGPVDGNIRLAGQTLKILKTANIKGDLLAAAQDLFLSSSISRDVLIAGEKINIDPIVKINGNMDYYVSPNSEATIAANVVKGKLTKHLLPQSTISESDSTRLKNTISAISKIISVFSVLAVGLFLILVFPHLSNFLSKDLKKSPVLLFFLGFATIFLTPVFIVILFMTIIGIPLAFILTLLYILGFFVAIPLSSIALGQLVHPNRFLSLLIGAVIFTLLSLLPAIGWFFGLLFLCLGFGLYIQLFISHKINYDPKN